MVDLFFYRDPDETEKQEEAQAEDGVYTRAYDNSTSEGAPLEWGQAETGPWEGTSQPTDAWASSTGAASSEWADSTDTAPAVGRTTEWDSVIDASGWRETQ